MTTRPLPRLLGLLLAGALVAAACGSSSKKGAAVTPTTAGTTNGTSGGTTGTTTGGSTINGIANVFSSHTGDAKSVDEYVAGLQKFATEVYKLVKPIDKQTGSTTQGVTKSQITIGSVTALTTASGTEPYPGMCEGAMAAIAAANKAGGVNGRQIVWAGAKDAKGRNCQDDNSNTDQDRQKLTDMVEGQKVFALLPVVSQGFLSQDYLNQKHIPYFGYGFQPGYCNQPFGFSETGAVSCAPIPGKAIFSDIFTSYAQAAHKNPADLKVGLISEENAAGTTGIKIVSNGLQIGGIKVVNANANYPAATAPPPSDITPFVNELLQGNPDVIDFVTSDKPIVPLATALRAAGFKGDFVNYVYEDERIFPVFNQQFKALDGAYTQAPGIGTPIPSDPAFTQISNDLTAAGFHVPITSGVLYGYGAAALFLQALKATPEPLTTEGLANTINNGLVDKGLGTALCPMVWPLGHVAGSPCGHSVKIDSKGTNHLDQLGIGKPGQFPGGLDPVVPGRYFNLFLTDTPK